MRCIAKFDRRASPPILKLWIQHAPHRRSDEATLKVYRYCLVYSCRRAGILTPIEDPLYLWVEFIDPTSPDLDNLLTALYRAMDGKSDHLGKHTVLADDKLIKHVTMGVLELSTLADHKKDRPLQLPRFTAIRKDELCDTVNVA